MAPPRLTFFCELEAGLLHGLFTDQTISDLLELKANVSLGILDLSSERAVIARRLNQAGIPVIAWLLLPKEQGYWFNLDNAPQAIARYEAFKEWTVEHGLHWDGVGLGIEPDIRDVARFATQRWRVLPQVVWRILERGRLRPARVAYQGLVSRIQIDGYKVDSYQFPVIDDERKVGSTLLQRAIGLVNISVDREVWMLYTSFLRTAGAGVIASYAPDAQSVGLGSTGGGVDAGFDAPPPLTWDELARDLRLAWHYCDDLFVFSLEGCVQHGYLSRMKSFVWDYPIMLPEQSMARVEGWRAGLQSILWVSAHLKELLLVVFGTWLIWRGVMQLWDRRSGVSEGS